MLTLCSALAHFWMCCMHKTASYFHFLFALNFFHVRSPPSFTPQRWRSLQSCFSCMQWKRAHPIGCPEVQHLHREWSVLLLWPRARLVIICVVLNLCNYISVRAYVVMDDYFWWYPCVLYQPLCTVDFVKKHKKSSLHHVSFLTKHCRKRFCSNFDSSCRVVCEETKAPF